ncbi:MAG: hypothetical protein M1823_003944 [Watsoniomyces obsoletus]|nr:MAG: hypothetical protein M1823_003944 [Watsoniomyces obsoletus]
MNGFASHGLSDGNFHEKNPSGDGGLGGGLRTFDAFPKTKTTYTTRHALGGQWTVILLLTCTLLSLSELRTWYRGHETRQFSVEKGVGHVLQINLDVVVAMPCHDLHVHVQDASGDLILASEMLEEDDTSWDQWRGIKDIHTLGTHGDWDDEMDEEDHVADVMAHSGGKKTFRKTPQLRGGMEGGACRIYGNMELNKVQGDFHITARGHGYVNWADLEQHLDHTGMFIIPSLPSTSPVQGVLDTRLIG